MVTGNDTMVYWLTLVEDRLKSLEKANQALLKRWRAKRIRVTGGLGARGAGVACASEVEVSIQD